MIVNASNRPMIGDSTMKTAIFWKAATSSAPQPDLATAAPASPPTSACEELVGKPTYHVITSQMIAPSRPANTAWLFRTPSLTMSVPMNLATAVPKTAKATKLKNAAQTTACFGDKTLVDTTVAIE